MTELWYTKYIKPYSLTWWSGVVPIMTGVFIACANEIPDLQPFARILTSLTGDIPPAVLINGGLAVIGLRGAAADARSTS